MNLPPKRLRRGGFTLIELLVVISVIAVLAAMVTGGLIVAQRNAKEKDTLARMKMIESGLEGYITDYNEYPVPAQPELSADVEGSTWVLGGAACLYQALLGDGTDHIQGFKPKRHESSGPSTGKLGSSETNVYLRDVASHKSMVGKAGGNWFLKDAFAHPFGYKPYDPQNPTETQNEGEYDMWSYGAEKRPSNDSESRKSWLKNWD